MTKIQALIRSRDTPKWVEDAARAAIEAAQSDPVATMNAAEFLSVVVRDYVLALMEKRNVGALKS